MGSYRLSPRTVPLDDTWDVIVAGGGPAGCTAAAAAAREGARTLLIEATGALGGMGTSGLVPAWCPFSDKQQMIYRGLAEKVFRAAGAGVPHVPAERLDWVPINPEHLKRVYDELLTDAGATALFHTALAAVDTADDGSIDAVVVAHKGGLAAYRARVYVDATGDADLAAWAGAEFHKGDDTGDLQPATHCFILANVDEYAYLNGPNLHRGDPASPIHRIVDSGKYPRIRDTHSCNSRIGPGTVGFNSGHLWNVDNTDPASVSRALIEGRRLATDFRDALAEFLPKAFANAFLVATGALMGIRETRRIVGDYVLTLDDYLARRSFPDEICRNAYYIDVHGSTAELEAEKAGSCRLEQGTHRYGPGESHGVPYRCLTPRGLPNVLVAGRSVSCDRAVQGSVRVMPVCLAMGEAAGVAAHMAARDDRPDVHTVDADALRTRLREHGAYLP